MKMKNATKHLLNEYGLVVLIRVGNSIWLKWVKQFSGTEVYLNKEILGCDPLIYIMKYFRVTVMHSEEAILFFL